jgi:MinD superfamily P-loop ATPase
MHIAIASGKGGTGKTLVATNLAAVWNGFALADLDVEEPNCYIFQRKARENSEQVHRPVPRVDTDRCTLCGTCGRVCEFHAIAVLPKKVMVFDELCHACGACSRFCPEEAIAEVPHAIGEAIESKGEPFDLVYGRLRVGEATAVPLIREVKRRLRTGQDFLLDCPPGTACTAVESIRGADFCVLVTEPTPFGLHDLKLALKVAENLHVRHGVFINKDGLPGPDIQRFCEENDVPVVGRLPLDRDIAVTYSRGSLLAESRQNVEVFEDLKKGIQEAMRS